MPCVKRSLLLAAVAFLTFFPKVTFAAAACECFCGEPKYGASSLGSMTSSECQTACTESDVQFVGCFTDPQHYPDRSPKCWTQEQCEDWTGLSGVTTIGATWAGKDMPYDCAATKTSQLPQNYCYADGAKYTLNIPIGSMEDVDNLPTYINTLYTWLLPAAALVAVVMMMIGGLQYTLSRGKSKYIEKAKTRITNAITGLVILLSVFVILNLIDPRLTILNPLKIPMLKEMVLLDSESSCERLADRDVGYDVTLVSGTASCGGTGQITGVDNLVSGAVGSWKKGDKCEYVRCIGADTGKVCVANGETKSCQSCASIPNPSASTCEKGESLNTSSGGGMQIYCEYDSVLKSCVTAGTSLSSYQGFSCPTMIAKAADVVSGTTTKKGCSVYEDLQVGSAPGGIAIISPLNSAASPSLLKKVCNDDALLCDVAGSVGGSRCEYSVGSADPGFIATAVNYWMGTSVGTTGYYCQTKK